MNEEKKTQVEITKEDVDEIHIKAQDFLNKVENYLLKKI